MEYPVYVISKVKNFLNLACWFSFDTSCPNSMFKTYLFLNFRCSEKGHRYFSFCEAPYIKCFQCKVSWFLIVGFTLSRVTQTPPVKRFHSLSVCKGSNNIDKALWKMAWILDDFDLSMLTRIPYVKHTNCENSRSTAKETSILLHSGNNLSIISSRWQISWILFDWSFFVTTFKIYI